MARIRRLYVQARWDRSDFSFIDFRFLLDVFTVSRCGIIGCLRFLLQEIRILQFHMYELLLIVELLYTRMFSITYSILGDTWLGLEWTLLVCGILAFISSTSLTILASGSLCTCCRKHNTIADVV